MGSGHNAGYSTVYSFLASWMFSPSSLTTACAKFPSKMWRGKQASASLLSWSCGLISFSLASRGKWLWWDGQNLGSSLLAFLFLEEGAELTEHWFLTTPSSCHIGRKIGAEQSGRLLRSLGWNQVEILLLARQGQSLGKLEKPFPLWRLGLSDHFYSEGATSQTLNI